MTNCACDTVSGGEGEGEEDFSDALIQTDGDAIALSETSGDEKTNANRDRTF
jgi:methylmalonyl-CoA mutase cobalamin-binding subunit